MFSTLLFLLIIFFLLSKLNDILGMRIGFHIQRDTMNNDLGDCENTITEVKEGDGVLFPEYLNFNSDDFLNKATKAFEIIFKSYADGDTRTLRELLAPRIYRAFSMAIDDRKLRKEVLEGSIVRIISSEIIESSSSENDIFITTKFVTEQSNVLRSADGKILEGDPDFITTHTDVWIFSKKKTTDDPRWYLFEIKSEQE